MKFGKKIIKVILSVFILLQLTPYYSKGFIIINAQNNGVDEFENIKIVTEETYKQEDTNVSKRMANVPMGNSIPQTQAFQSKTSMPYWTETNGVKNFYDAENNLMYHKGTKKIIDVSEHNGKINWEKVKSSGVDGAIIRVGWGYLGEDKYFQRNVSECNRLGIPYGIYLYSYAYDANFAYAEANGTAEMLSKVNLNLSYPIYYDIEAFKSWTDSDGSIRKHPNTPFEYEQVIATYINRMNELGYNGKVHVYSYRSYLQNQLNSPKILPYVSWIAAYTPTLGFENEYYNGEEGWQYTSSGYTDGIDGRVDISCFSDQFFNKKIIIEAPKLESIKASKGVLTLSWNKIEGATAYNIYRYNRETSKYERITWTKDTSIQLKDQPKGVTNTYRVKAYYKGNGKTVSSTYSNSQSAKLFTETKIQNIEQEGKALQITWTKVSGTNGYSVYRKKDTDKEWTYLDATAKTTFTDKTAEEGVRYQYRILPYGKVNGVAFFGPYSKSASGMVFRTIEISNTTTEDGDISFKWNEVPGVDGYNIYRYNEETKKWDYMNSVLKGNSYTDRKVKEGNEYRYRIRPYYRTLTDKVKYGNYSEEIEIRAGKTAIPTFIEAPKLEPIKASKGILTLTWNKVDGATAYNIYHYNRQTLKYERIGWTKDTSIQLKDQPKGEIDTYRVKAYYKKDGKTIISKYSNSQSAKLFEETKIQNIEQEENTLKIIWTEVKGTNGYSVYRKEETDKEWTYLDATAETTYTDKTAKEGIRYQYRILPYGRVNGVVFFGPYSKSASGIYL